MGVRIVARWVSVGGAHYVDLVKQDGSGWSYTGNGAGGYLGNGFASDADAIAEFEKRVNDFQPDRNKTPMKRVK